ncbi:MAG: hypothetical protein F6K26_37735 [Moorea sp. SIO2I5]|nr:hypothetical protein [Moorena sp. SIO2I5]
MIGSVSIKRSAISFLRVFHNHLGATRDGEQSLDRRSRYANAITGRTSCNRPRAKCLCLSVLMQTTSGGKHWLPCSFAASLDLKADCSEADP